MVLRKKHNVLVTIEFLIDSSFYGSFHQYEKNLSKNCENRESYMDVYPLPFYRAFKMGSKNSDLSNRYSTLMQIPLSAYCTHRIPTSGCRSVRSHLDLIILR